MRIDPTRMAQGIMTGIGFLGAGVIFKEGLTVRGLTTAASIWITAAIGVLMGSGLYYPAIGRHRAHPRRPRRVPLDREPAARRISSRTTGSASRATT